MNQTIPNTQNFQVGATAVIRKTQVEEQVYALETFAQDLGVIVETLQKRLCSVTEPRQEKLNAEPSAPRATLVPLADKLRSVGDAFTFNINQLRELNGSIELPN